MKVKKGWGIHCHHDILVEYVYDYDKRVDYIQTKKPENEIATRLKLFKLLPKKAVNEIPKAWQDAYHDKWCGCREWDGKVIRFEGGIK
mgnify:CR=1 FL=1